MAKVVLGSIPHKGKVSFQTRCFLKYKQLELWWRRWMDSDIRKQHADALARKNPFHPDNSKRF